MKKSSPGCARRNDFSFSYARLLFIQILAAALLFPLGQSSTTTVLANMASPIRAGNALGEPSADLSFIRIERETLTIDLRPLSNGSPAVVEAVYKVRNEGEGRALDLIFVANSMTADGGGVWLDEERVPSRSGDAQGLPESWQPPRTTPRIGGGAPLSYEVKREGAMTFTLQLAPGEHAIRVRYQAQATANSSDKSPTIYWQLGYVLSPARSWAGFGGLDAKVMLPAGWSAASDPSMKREGDTLVGTWTELPSDALALTVQSPPPQGQALYTTLKVLIFVVGLLVCLMVGWLAGRWLGRRQRTSAWALPLSLALAFLWGLSFFLSDVAMMDAVKSRLGAQAPWTNGYGVFVTLIYFMAMVPLGLVLTQLIAFIAARRAREPRL